MEQVSTWPPLHHTNVSQDLTKHRAGQQLTESLAPASLPPWSLQTLPFSCKNPCPGLVHTVRGEPIICSPTASHGTVSIRRVFVCVVSHTHGP